MYRNSGVRRGPSEAQVRPRRSRAETKSSGGRVSYGGLTSGLPRLMVVQPPSPMAKHFGCKYKQTPAVMDHTTSLS